jgi:hypothetical protein
MVLNCVLYSQRRRTNQRSKQAALKDDAKIVCNEKDDVKTFRNQKVDIKWLTSKDVARIIDWNHAYKQQLVSQTGFSHRMIKRRRSQ